MQMLQAVNRFRFGLVVVRCVVLAFVLKHKFLILISQKHSLIFQGFTCCHQYAREFQFHRIKLHGPNHEHYNFIFTGSKLCQLPDDTNSDQIIICKLQHPGDQSLVLLVTLANSGYSICSRTHSISLVY
ncbi:hypothetical protein ACOSQ3_000600 [Xanthoceras sorbifolium]